MTTAEIDALIKKHSNMIPYFYMVEMKKQNGRSTHEPELIMSPISLPDAQAVGCLMKQALSKKNIKTVIAIIAIDGARNMETVEKTTKYGMGYAFDAGINLRLIYADPEGIGDYVAELMRGDYS